MNARFLLVAFLIVISFADVWCDDEDDDDDDAPEYDAGDADDGNDTSEESVYDENGILMTTDHSFRSEI
jgi:hypothetical protein